MPVARWVARLLLPAVVVATTGCFATRNDVRLVQQDVRRAQAALERRDSVRAEQDARLAALVTSALDSLRSVSAQLSKHNAESKESLYAVGQQLLQVLDLQGLSQRRLQELRAELESRAQAPVVVPPPQPVVTGRDSVVPVTVPPTAAGPGPNQLYQLGFDQLRRASYGAARAAFGELLTTYPRSELAADAQYHVAVAFASEGQEAAADSVYALVVERYPQSPRAPTALYKRGVALAAAGQTRLARTLLQQVIGRYRTAPEVELARDRLATLPPTP
jgi:tol-pal system protein YbgF